MEKRPTIPAQLARRILVEAGHRCAIHTCRHPAVDIHHIEPWSKVREHSYNNLITLCPNCHRRADRGEIDQLSLKEYKARLISKHVTKNIDGTGNDASPTGTPLWQVAVVRERNQQLGYEVELEYPQFLEGAPDIGEVNDLERAAAVRRLQEFRESQFRARDDAEAGALPGRSQLSSSFEVMCIDNDVISIRHRIFHFGAGAAHPNHQTAVSNFQRNPTWAVTLRGLFEDVDYLGALSDYCIADLLEQRQISEPTAEILLGTAPKEENFARFCIAPVGLVITFDEYAVGSYSEGGFTVIIPRERLAGMLKQNAPISRYLRRDAG